MIFYVINLRLCNQERMLVDTPDRMIEMINPYRPKASAKIKIKMTPT